MAYIFGSIWDRFNRNALNDLSKNVEIQGKTMQDLVAEGQLTPSQYAQLVSIVNGNVKKGSITINDIDKNNFKIDQTYLTDELKQQMTGDAPINAVPADNSIDTIKLIDGSVTKAKRTVGGESAYAMPGASTKIPNIDTTKKTITFYGTTFFYHSKGRVSVQADTSVDFSVGSSVVVAVDINSGDISARSGADMFTLSEDEVVLMHIVFTTTTQSYVRSVASNFDVTVDDKPIEKELITGSVTTDKLSDGAVTTDKRTSNGETVFLMPGFNADLLNINTVEHRFEISATSYLYFRNKRHTIDEDIHFNWEAGGSQFLTFNTESRTFKSRSGGNYLLIGENDILIAHVVFTSTTQSYVKTVASNFDVTVNGKTIEKELITGSVTTDKLSDGAVTRDKRTANGETAFLMPGFSADLLNINTVEKRFEISATSFLYWRNRRQTIDEDIHLNWEVGGNQFLTFNTESRTFKSRTGGNYPLISENDILIAHVVFTEASQNNVKTAKAITDFTVNGFDYYNQNTGETEKTDIIKDKVLLHSPLSGYDFVDTPVMETVARDTPNYIKAKTHQDIYADYDALMNRHTEIMTKRISGVDAWGNNINRYDIKPPELIGSNTDNNLPKILWVVSVHGSEKTAGWVAFKTLEYILDNYKTDKRLENFVYNNHLIILPTANPSGWDDNTRHNRNGVDLNRNQPTSWTLLDEESVVYGGPHALSENESIIINDIIHNESNLKYVADFHNFFLPAEDNYFLWIPSRSKQIVNMAKSFIYSFSREIVKEYPELPANTYFGYSSETFVGGSIGNESVNNGIYGSTFEVCEIFKMGDEVLNSSMVITAGVKGFLNWNILMWQTLRTIDNEME